MGKITDQLLGLRNKLFRVKAAKSLYILTFSKDNSIIQAIWFNQLEKNVATRIDDIKTEVTNYQYLPCDMHIYKANITTNPRNIIEGDLESYLNNPKNKCELFDSCTLNTSSDLTRLDKLSTQIETQVSARAEHLNKLSEKEQIAAVLKAPNSIEYINNPSEKLQFMAVRKEPSAIQYIANPTESVKFSIVESNPEAIQYIHNPSEEIQMLAVKNNPSAIVYIYYPTEAVQLAAVRQDENAIEYIQNPTEQVQLAAVQKDPSILEFIENPSEQVQMAAKDIKEVVSEQLSKLNITLPEQERIISELLTAGKTNSLVPIRTSILNQEVNALARLSLNNDAAHSLKLHFIRHNIKSDLDLPFMGYYFTNEQKQNLLTTKNAGEIIEIQGVNGKPQQVLVSVDRLTGELISQPVERVLIPEAFRGVSLSEADKQKLKTGQPLIIERVKASRGTEYSITVQYNADLRKVVALANSNKITIVGGATLSEKDSESLRMGKTIQVSNLIDDKGEKYSAFVRLRYPKEDILITPTNAHKIQVSHNNHGEKTEQNKKLEKSEGQSPVKSGTTQAKRTKRKIN